MPSLTIRNFKSSEKLELSVESIDELSVQELKDRVSSSMGIPLEELKLVYGGRILKTGKTVTEYKVVPGCTIFVMAIKPKKRSECGIRGRSAAGGLMNNRRVLALIGRVLGNPAIFQDMLQNITGSVPPMFQILNNPQLLANLSDPDNIQEYIRENPDIGIMMEHLIQQYLDVGDAQAMEEDQVVDLLESHLEEEMAQVEREEEVRRTQAQEQMFEHSQALHAHQRQQQSSNNATGVAIQETSFNPSTSQQHGSLLFGRQNSGGAAITQDQLTSALANAMNNTGASPSTSRHSHSPLTSLNFTQNTSSGQPRPQSSDPPPPYSQLLGTSSSSSSLFSSQNSGRIDAASLRQALANVVPTTTASSSFSSRPPESRQNGGVDRNRYRVQLEQLRLMGIEDEVACLHALAAANGDLQAALEILYSK